MTLPAYSGRHALFDATTVLPAVLPAAPPAGAPPGRPAVVDAAFWVAVASAVVAVLCALPLTFLLLALAAGYGSWAGMAFGVGLLLGTAAVNAGWLVLGWRMRRGLRSARTVFAVLTGAALVLTALVCVVAWATVVPVLALVLQGTVLVLLFRPSANAWFAALSPAPGPGSPRR